MNPSPAKKARTESATGMRGSHVLSSKDISREQVDLLCASAHQMLTQVPTQRPTPSSLSNVGGR